VPRHLLAQRAGSKLVLPELLIHPIPTGRQATESLAASLATYASQSLSQEQALAGGRKWSQGSGVLLLMKQQISHLRLRHQRRKFRLAFGRASLSHDPLRELRLAN